MRKLSSVFFVLLAGFAVQFPAHADCVPLKDRGIALKSGTEKIAWYYDKLSVNGKKKYDDMMSAPFYGTLTDSCPGGVTPGVAPNTWPEESKNCWGAVWIATMYQNDCEQVQPETKVTARGSSSQPSVGMGDLQKVDSDISAADAADAADKEDKARKQACENSGGTYGSGGGTCSCPSDYILSVVSVGGYNKVIICSQCSEGTHPNSSRDGCTNDNEQSSEPSVGMGDLQKADSDISSSSPKGESSSEMTNVGLKVSDAPKLTENEKAFNDEFDKLTARYNAKISALSGK